MKHALYYKSINIYIDEITYFGPYRGWFKIDCTVVSLSWKLPYGRGDLSDDPSAESVKSELRFCRYIDQACKSSDAAGGNGPG